MQSPRRILPRTGDSRRGVKLAALALAAAGALLFGDARALWVRPVEDPPPSVLDAVPDAPDLNNVALTDDGSRAAASFVQQLNERKYRSTIRFYDPGSDEPAEVTLAGEVRDLLFAPDGETLFALFHIPAKKRPGDVDLLRIDATSKKTRRRLRAPPSAVGLAYWPDGNALLIVCAHEIRSLLLPDLRSGPLYRLIGVNTGAVVLDGARLLVAREDGLSLIDLGDPPGEDQMPVRMRIDSDRAVVQVATNRDGSKILVRLLEGGIARVDLASASLVPDLGDGVLPTRPWPSRESVPGLSRKPEPQRALPAEPEPVAEPEPGADAGVRAEAEIAATPSEAETATDRPAPLVEPQRAGPAPQVAGTITGPGAGTVSAVVVFGPDNIVREAWRVTPDGEGRWRVDGLQPGRYRIQLVAGDGQVPVVDPPFRSVEIVPHGPTVTVSFEVLASR